MYWSPVERSIDQCLHLVYSQFNGKKLIGKKPVQLQQKLDYILRCHNEIPALINNKEHIANLVLITKPVAEKRNIFVHGLIEEWSSNQIKISKIKRDGEHLKEIFTINIQMLESNVSNLSELSNRWGAIVLLLQS